MPTLEASVFRTKLSMKSSKVRMGVDDMGAFKASNAA